MEALIMLALLSYVAPPFALWLVSQPSKADKATTEAVTREALRLLASRR
jgi:hypothetical protein